MPLDVGIVGLPGSGKTALFNALTRAAASEHELKEHVGMATIADDRLDRLALVESSAKVTPATIRVVDVPGTGPALLGNLRRSDALLAVVRDDGDLENLKLEQKSERDGKKVVKCKPPDKNFVNWDKQTFARLIARS